MKTNKTKNLKKLSLPTRHLTVSRKLGSSDMPSLLLAGRWLESAGFNIGDIVQVEVTDSQIVINRTTHKWATEEKVVTKRMKVNEFGTPLKT